jgi:2-polyprenyl-3-methyl-5-hydroxy-6-metoxy-1,4-benzoquinol methylase
MPATDTETASGRPAGCVVCGSTSRAGAYPKGAWVYERCSGCGLLSSDPIPTTAEIETHYRDKLARGNYAIGLRYAEQYRRVHAEIADWIDPRPGARILDIGSFTGTLLEILLERGADPYGLELQPEAVAIANERLGGRVFQADVHGTSFPAGPYDIISMIAVIEHVVDPRQMIRRARELLVDGGRVYIETPNAGSGVARALGRAWPPLAPVEHIHLFSARALRMLLEQEGFDDIRVQRHVKRLPMTVIHEQLAHFGGAAWQRATAPVTGLLGMRAVPLYVGEMLVSARSS